MQRIFATIYLIGALMVFGGAAAAQADVSIVIRVAQLLVPTRGAPAPQLMLLSRGAQAPTPAALLALPSVSGVWGVARVLRLEQPALNLAIVDAPVGEGPPSAGTASFGASAEAEIAWCSGRPHVARLRRPLSRGCCGVCGSPRPPPLPPPP